MIKTMRKEEGNGSSIIDFMQTLFDQIEPKVDVNLVLRSVQSAVSFYEDYGFRKLTPKKDQLLLSEMSPWETPAAFIFRTELKFRVSGSQYLPDEVSVAGLRSESDQFTL